MRQGAERVPLGEVLWELVQAAGEAPEGVEGEAMTMEQCLWVIDFLVSWFGVSTVRDIMQAVRACPWA